MRDIKSQLKENMIHKSFLALFSKTDCDHALNMLIDTYKEFKKYNSLPLELDFQNYFQKTSFISIKDIALYNQKIEQYLNSEKADKFIRRNVPIRYRHYFYYQDINNKERLINLFKKGIEESKIKPFFKSITAYEDEFKIKITLQLIENLSKEWNFNNILERLLQLNKNNFDIISQNKVLINTQNDNDVICKLGSYFWCITKRDFYIDYTTNLYEKIFIYYDYSKNYNEPMSLVAIILNKENKIDSLFDRFNKELKDKELKEHFQKIINDSSINKKSFNFKSNHLNKALYDFKSGNYDSVKKNIIKYNVSNEHKSENNLNFALVKSLELFKPNDIRFFFELLNEDKELKNNYIKDSQFYQIIGNIKDFENKAFNYSSTRIFLKYINKGDSNILSNESLTASFYAMSKNRMKPIFTCEDVFLKRYLSAEQHEVNQMKDIINNYFKKIESQYSDDAIQGLFKKQLIRFQDIEMHSFSFLNFVINYNLLKMINDNDFSLKRIEKVYKDVFNLFDKYGNPIDFNVSKMINLRTLILSNLIKSVPEGHPKFSNTFNLFIIKTIFNKDEALSNECYYLLRIKKENRLFTHEWNKELVQFIKNQVNSTSITKKELLKNNLLRTILLNLVHSLTDLEFEEICEDSKRIRTINALKMLKNLEA